MGLVLLAGLGACGGAASTPLEGDVTVEYSVSASRNYELGMRHLKDEEWLEAAKYFAFIKARFPYSKFAVLADLRLADAQFGGGAYLEAIDTYKQFIKFHPTHEMVENGYAGYRIGSAYVQMLPEDFFLLPPAHERDQTAAHDALRELDAFLKKHPESRYFAKAKELHRKTARSLADHEWYVADFYWRMGKYTGTVIRLRTIVAKYPDVGYDERALHRLGDAYLASGRAEDARKAWQSLVDRFPKHPLAADARQRLLRAAR